MLPFPTLTEVNENFKEQKEGVKLYLENTGWIMESKKHGDWVKGTDEETTFNQIWIRPPRWKFVY